MNVPAARILFSPEDRRMILDEIDTILASGQLTLGERTRRFETRFAEAVGTPYAVAVSSGTAALEICLRILNVSGKEVIVPANTFYATAAAVVHAGGRPRFVDIEPETLAFDLKQLESAITQETRGVILVHVGGWVSAHAGTIRALCRERGLFLLEDAAHAHGSLAPSGESAGSLGEAAAFSFYPTKVMTSAEGGMITTRDARFAEEARLYRDQGKESFTSNFHTRLGYNWRLSELHATVGLSQLHRLQGWIEERIRAARIYDALLAENDVLSPLPFPKAGRTNYYKYIVRLARPVERKPLKARLRESGVGLAGEVYETACHDQPVFAPWRGGACPVAEKFCAEHLCLPIYPTLSEEEATHVVRSLRAALQEIGCASR